MDQYLFLLICPFIVLLSLFVFQPRFVTVKYGLRGVLANPETKERTGIYRKRLYQYLGIFTLLTLPNVLLAYLFPSHLSLSFSYMLVWIVIWLYAITFRLIPGYQADLWAIKNRHANQSRPKFVNLPMKIAAAVSSLIMLTGILLFLYIDFGTMSVQFKGDMVSIKAPLFSCQFSKNDIQSVTETNAMPRGGKRIKGTETPKVAYGHFSFDGIEHAELCIYHGVKPIIVIVFKNKTLFLNGKTPEETALYYKKLTNTAK